MPPFPEILDPPLVIVVALEQALICAYGLRRPLVLHTGTEKEWPEQNRIPVDPCSAYAEVHAWAMMLRL